MRPVLATTLFMLAIAFCASLADSWLVHWDSNPTNQNVQSYWVSWQVLPNGAQTSLATTSTMVRLELGPGIWRVQVGASNANGFGDLSFPIYITNLLNRVAVSNLSANFAWMASNAIPTNQVFRLWRSGDLTQWAGIVEFRFLTTNLTPKMILFELNQGGPEARFYKMEQ